MILKLEIDDEEIKFMIKEAWLKEGRHQVSRLMDKELENKVMRFLEKHEKQFEELLKDSLDRVLNRYKIRDMMELKKVLKKR